jgi:O-antigen/teichoic acid export membrane protein
MISLLARFGGGELVGQYALGIALCAPVLILLPPNRRTAADTDIRVMSLVFAIFGVAAVGFLEHSQQDRAAVLIVALAQAVEGVATLYAGRRTAMSLMLHGSGSVAALGIVAAASGRIGAGLLAVLVVRLFLLFFYDFPRTSLRPHDLREKSLQFLSTSVPFYFVAHMLGFQALGIFAAVASLMPVVEVIIAAVGEEATPELASVYQLGDRTRFIRLSLQLAACGLILGLAALAVSINVGPVVLNALFGPEYASHANLLVALTAASGVGFVASLLNCPLNAGRRFEDQLTIEIAAVGTCSFVAVALVPRIGLLGAAFAVGFASFVRIIGQLWALHTMLRRRKTALLSLLNDPLVAEK